MKYTWEFEERDTWRFDEFDTYVGEVAEDRCIDYTEITQLENTINTVVHKWLKETDNLPNFYWVKNIREIEIT